MVEFVASLVSLAVFAVCTVITIAVVVPLQLVALPWDPERNLSARVARWTWGVLLFALQPFWRSSRTGLERVGPGPWIIVANHQSVLDIPVLLQLPVSFRVVARPYVFTLPVFGQMASFAGHVRLDASTPAGIAAGLEHCKRLLASGVSVVIFPEGTRSTDGALLPFARGGFQLAIDTNTPLLPVCLDGTRHVLPKGGLFPSKGRVDLRLHVLEPIALEGRNRRRLAALAQAQIQRSLALPGPHALADAVGAVYARQGFLRGKIARGKVLADPVYWELLERLPPGAPIVDLGCGEGLLACYLRAAGRVEAVRGVDVDPRRLASAREANPEATFEQGDLESLALAQCPVIVCVDVLHYLPADRQLAALERLSRALAPGGVLFVRDGERAAGWRGVFTRTSERLAVAVGRHAGGGVHMIGSDAIAGVLARTLVDVKAEPCGGSLFANTLTSARRAA